MALTTDRISVLRGRPPVRAGGRRGFRTAHCWLVRSLGYGFGFIPFLRSRPPLLEQTLRASDRADQSTHRRTLTPDPGRQTVGAIGCDQWREPHHEIGRA